jgi:hypothetical protein
VTNAGVTAPPETVKVTLSTDRVAAVHLLTDRWSFGITVAYSGAGTGGSIDVSATNDAATSLATSVIQTITIPNVSKDTPFTTTLSDPVSALGQLPGLYHVTITAHVGSATDSATCAVPVYYDLFVIDTYDPSTTFASGANVIDLFGPAGDTSTLDGLSGFNLWAQGGTLVSAALASDDGSAPARPVTSDYSGSGFAYAQFAGGIEPGKTYYIRSRMVNFSATMGYAIRILTAPGATYSTADMSVSIPSAGTTDDPAPLGGLGVPGGSQNPAASVNPIALGQAQGKMLSAGGVHWFKVILP